jgi:hypothetical protein
MKMKSQSLLISLGVLIGILGTFQIPLTLASNLLANADNEVKPDSGKSTDKPKSDSESTVDEATKQTNIDYSKLEEYLSQKNWKEADQETYKLLLLAVGGKSVEQGRFVTDEWQKADYCPAFVKINDLWKNASKNNLGFTSQREVLEKQEGRDFNRFYVAIKWKKRAAGNDWLVGWRYDPESKKVEYREGMTPKFDLEEFPTGYLPAKLGWEPDKEGRLYDNRFQAIDKCGL